MGRWEPDAAGRFRAAAIELFEEVGYEPTSVAAIAERAGLTARTFFRHFAAEALRIDGGYQTSPVGGARFLLAPRAAAAGYGVHAKPDGDSAYLTIKGQRDFTLAVVGAALLAFSDAHAVGWYMLAGALIPLTDTLIVLRHGGSKAVAFGIHFATAVILLLDAALLFAL